MTHEPFGGRSLLELGTELRLRITESFGIVGFFVVPVVGYSTLSGCETATA